MLCQPICDLSLGTHDERHIIVQWQIASAIGQCRSMNNRVVCCDRTNNEPIYDGAIVNGTPTFKCTADGVYDGISRGTMHQLFITMNECMFSTSMMLFTSPLVY